jgi:S-adenosyl-L-methionine hydrolase (adenosine-forming)
VPPLVTLTSDFGSGGPYVAAMKAVLLAGCPGVQLIDVSHDVPAFDVIQGAFVLWAGTRHFQPGAVHLAVVDPGVGTSRRPVALSLGGSWYVGPDNGLFGLVLQESHEAPATAIELERPAGASATFEGRDVFAPAAAALACGASPKSLGTPLAADLVPLPVAGPAVLWVDVFGNLVTNLKPPLTGVVVNGRSVSATARTFAEAPAGEPFCYLGSMGFVEIGLSGGRADAALDAGPGTPISRS